MKANELAKLESLLAASRQECDDYAKRLGEANDQLAELRSRADLRSEMVKAQDPKPDAGTVTVEMDGVSVTYEPNAHCAEAEMYRLCGEVRQMMISRGLYVRGDFTIVSKRPR